VYPVFKVGQGGQAGLKSSQLSAISGQLKEKNIKSGAGIRACLNYFHKLPLISLLGHGIHVPVLEPQDVRNFQVFLADC
jgi:hypothetical protein